MAASFDADSPVRPIWSRPAPTRGADEADAPPRAREFSAYRMALGLAVIVLGPLLFRLGCEALLVVFRIYEELKEANDRHWYRA